MPPVVRKGTRHRVLKRPKQEKWFPLLIVSWKHHLEMALAEKEQKAVASEAATKSVASLVWGCPWDTEGIFMARGGEKVFFSVLFL